MGLDMYLNANRYMSRWFNKTDTDKQNAIQILFPELANLKSRSDDESPVKEVTIEAAYWRKANAIHGWFVANVQKGVDDCGTYYVGREQLEELKMCCERALDDPDNTDKHLPTASGFFFGGTQYDEWYFDGLRYTIKAIEDALTLPESWTFEYHSSW